MTSDQLRKSIVASFERHREAPSTNFDPDKFLNFLTDPPSRPGASFSGNRRYQAFIREVQLGHGVMLAQSDHDKSFSLEGFADRIEYLKSDRSGSLRSLRHARRHTDFNLILFGNVILFALGGWSRGHPILFWLIVASAIAFNGIVIALGLRERHYLSRLAKRIEES